MKKSDYLVLIFSALLFVGVLPVYAGGHGWHGGDGHFGIWIGPGWAGWGPWWWSGAYYPYYPYYAYGSGYPYYPPQQQPSVYVEQTPQTDEQTYWYFCPDARNYYPYVKRCPKGWLKVIPPSPQPE